MMFVFSNKEAVNGKSRGVSREYFSLCKINSYTLRITKAPIQNTIYFIYLHYIFQPKKQSSGRA